MAGINLSAIASAVLPLFASSREGLAVPGSHAAVPSDTAVLAPAKAMALASAATATAAVILADLDWAAVAVLDRAAAAAPSS